MMNLLTTFLGHLYLFSKIPQIIFSLHFILKNIFEYYNIMRKKGTLIPLFLTLISKHPYHIKIQCSVMIILN